MSDALPDDPETLKAMLLDEQCESERLRQIIKELQGHRFGRRAETLLEDQMLLAWKTSSKSQRTARRHRTSVHLKAVMRELASAGATVAALPAHLAADRGHRRHRGQDLSLLPRRVTPDRRG